MFSAHWLPSYSYLAWVRFNTADTDIQCARCVFVPAHRAAKGGLNELVYIFFMFWSICWYGSAECCPERNRVCGWEGAKLDLQTPYTRYGSLLPGQCLRGIGPNQDNTSVQRYVQACHAHCLGKSQHRLEWHIAQGQETVCQFQLRSYSTNLHIEFAR